MYCVVTGVHVLVNLNYYDYNNLGSSRFLLFCKLFILRYVNTIRMILHISVIGWCEIVGSGLNVHLSVM